MTPLVDHLGLILTPTAAPLQGDVPVRGPSGGWTTMQPNLSGGYAYVDPAASPGQIFVFRTDGTVGHINPPAINAQAWGVLPTASSSANATNLQLAITAAAANSGQGTGTGGPAGKIELGSNIIVVNQAILTKFGVKLYGAGGVGNTILRADPAAPLSNFTNGSRSNFPAILKWDGGDAYAHGVHVVGIEFDTSGIPGLSATWFQATGENSWFDDLSCNGCAALPRTVNDAQLTAGSTTVTFTTSTVTEDDVNAILTMGGTVAAPGAPSLSTASTGGTIGSTSQTQQFTVGITYLTANGETAISPTTSITVSQVATNTITITSPPAVAGATGWFAYVSQPGITDPLTRQQAPGAATAIGTNLTLTAPPTSTGANPYNKIDRIGWGANSSAATATSMVMRNPAAATLANVTMTIARPTDAFVFDGGATPACIGQLHGVKNSGALVRWKNYAGNTTINQLSGDDNVGGMCRASKAAQAGDPAFLQIANIKSESDQYNTNWQYSMDPVILLDRCWTLAVNILSGTFLVQAYGRDVVRLDNSWSNADVGGPSLFLQGIEGQNWYNPAYLNIIHDTLTGEAIPVSAYGNQHPYPNIYWGRNLLLGGGADIPDLADWDRFISVAEMDPPIKYNNATSNWASGNWYLGATRYNATGAQNDGFGWHVKLSKGTWNLNSQGATDPTHAIITWDFSMDNGITWTTIGTMDQYAGVAGWFSGQINGITIPKTGIAILRARVLTRNASASGWIITISSIHLMRTA